jgi:hypothetical protein
MKKTLVMLTTFLLFAGCGDADGDDDTTTNNTSTNNTSTNNTTTNNTTTNNTATNNTTTNNTSTNNTSTNNTATNNTATNNTATNNSGGPRLADIFDAVFETSGCTAGYCHGGAVDGLVMRSVETVHQNTIDVTSIRPACGKTKIIVPGQPEESLLWLRVRPKSMDTEDCIEKMPRGTDGLDPETAQLVYDWIAGGANP